MKERNTDKEHWSHQMEINIQVNGKQGYNMEQELLLMRKGRKNVAYGLTEKEYNKSLIMMTKGNKTQQGGKVFKIVKED